jgi:chemotaxis protein methyltransferase CheR
MLLEEQDIAGRVVGTDISTAALQRAAVASYHARELSGLSPRRIASHLRPTADGWQVNTAIRNRVTILRHNLLDPLPADVQSCHVIFCRNVLIYLSPKHVRAFLDRIANTFPASTPIFLGAAETIWQVSDRFIAVPVGDTFIYRRAIVGSAAAKTHAQRTGPADTGRDAAAPPVRLRRPQLVAGHHQKDSGRSAAGRAEEQPSLEPETGSLVEQLAKVAHDAIAVGDFGTAVVAFRKCAYLAPDDPVAQLHLGLALDAAGDEPSAQRAFAAARQALLRADSAHLAEGFEGYATTELASLLDSKQRRATW